MNNNKNIEQWTEEFNTFAETEEARDYCFGNYNNATRDEQVGLFCYLAARKKAQEELQKRDAEIVKLKEISDMKSAIIEGMRRVCAIARMVNNQRPDVRMTAAFESYDISKLNNSHLEIIKKRDELLEQAIVLLTQNTHKLSQEQWLKQYEEMKR